MKSSQESKTVCAPIVSLLKSCAENKDLHRGANIHANILRNGLFHKNAYLASAVVSMYAKCGAHLCAQQVFDGILVRDIITWNALIAGYAQLGLGKEAFICFEHMQYEGLLPNIVTFISILKACGSTGLINKGEKTHEEIVIQGFFGADIVLDTALIGMYSKFGMVTKGQQVLDELPVRNVVSWSVLIQAYAELQQGEKALRCFEQMQWEGLCPNSVTFICILKACSSLGAVDKGEKIYQEIMSQGFLEKDAVLGTALVDMFAKCGAFEKAQDVLEELSMRNVVSWSALIAGYAQFGRGEEALKCFGQMLQEGFSPNAVTLTCILKACKIMKATDKGKRVHDEIVRQELLGNNFVLGTALVDMYAKCGALAVAQQVFTDLHIRDLAAWNALIAGYVQQSQGQDALICFEQLRCEGLSPNVITFACILNACGNVGAIEKGIQLHEEISFVGLLVENVVVSSALVDMYTKFGMLTTAQKLLAELFVRDVVAWNTLIAGYAQQEQGEEALKCFERMKREGISPDTSTFTCILKACGSIGAAAKGKQIHDETVSAGVVEKNVVLGSAVVDMYAKCGLLPEAQLVLDGLLVRNEVTWNALIVGYARKVQGEDALNCLQRMQCEGLFPDTVTLTCVLNACSRSGLVNEALTCLSDMVRHYGIAPDVGHYTCIVDLFGRIGHFDKAISLIKKVSSPDYSSAWSCLLAACQKWANAKLGKWVFEHAVQVEGSVPMACMWAAICLREEAVQIK